MSFEPKIIKANVFKDSRGYFSEVLKGFGFSQINMSWSIGGTFRGIHAQRLMDKAMWVASGKAIVYAVNLDPNSILYGKVIAETMEAGDGKVFYAPWWWGRGFLALEDTTVTYATTDVYRPEHEIGISYIGLLEIEKDLEKIKAQLIVSEKDQKAAQIKAEGTSDLLANWKRAGDDLLQSAQMGEE
jgi:dTDP-4-dehydrorhamnose 3,5-epimerase-like enzyme